jgi:CubicO group peptidase (beta-lactamase class C family)
MERADENIFRSGEMCRRAVSRAVLGISDFVLRRGKSRRSSGTRLAVPRRREPIPENLFLVRAVRTKGGFLSSSSRAARFLAVAIALAFAAPARAEVESAFDGGSGGATRRRDIERSRKLLADVLELYPGTTVAVALEDRVVWSAGFGYANVKRQVPVKSTTRFRIDRVSESLTAAALVRLADEGKLDLDAPLQRYLPAFPDKGYPLTPRLLAAHLAGFATSFPPRAAPRNCSQPEETARALAALPLSRIPGTRYLHSSPGYVLLSAVVAAACGQDFPSCVQEKVLRPAGMTATALEDPRAAPPNSATPYERGWFGMLAAARPVDNSCKWGAGGFVSTAEDLARFGLALLRGDIVKRESLPLLFSPQKSSAGESTGNGLGWQVGVDIAGRRRLVQSGRTVGGRSVVVLVPESRLSVALLANVDGEHLDDHALKIAELFAEPE